MKITFSNFGTYGRLGNQLWQYAFLKAFQQKRNADVFLPILNEKEWHGQKCLMNCFNLSLPQKYNDKQFYKWTEKDPQIYDPTVEWIARDTDFLGFFQNTKYFEGFEEIIKKDLTLKANLNEIIQKQMNNLREIGKRELVSVHIRRGDLTEQPKNNNSFETTESIQINYIKNALEYFPKDKYAFLIFTGGSRENDYTVDIEWCKKNLPFDWENDFVQIYNSGNTILDFAFISACDHNIMSHASSFSWWAAYLNYNRNKKVIAPKLYFIENRTRFIEDFYPKEFTLI